MSEREALREIALRAERATNREQYEMAAAELVRAALAEAAPPSRALDVLMEACEEAHIYGPDHERRPIFECSYEPCRQRRAVISTMRAALSPTAEPAETT